MKQEILRYAEQHQTYELHPIIMILNSIYWDLFRLFKVLTVNAKVEVELDI